MVAYGSSGRKSETWHKHVPQYKQLISCHPSSQNHFLTNSFIRMRTFWFCFISVYVLGWTLEQNMQWHRFCLLPNLLIQYGNNHTSTMMAIQLTGLDFVLKRQNVAFKEPRLHVFLNSLLRDFYDQHPYVFLRHQLLICWAAHFQSYSIYKDFQLYAQPLNVKKHAPQPPEAQISCHGYGFPPNWYQPPLHTATQYRHSFSLQKLSKLLKASNVSPYHHPNPSHGSQVPHISLKIGQRYSDDSYYMSHQLCFSALCCLSI